MAVTHIDPYVKYIQDANGYHAIDATKLNGKTYEEIVGAGFQIKIGDSLPTASADYNKTLYLIPDTPDKEENGDYLEYVCINKGTAASPNWAWEPIGTTKIKFTGGIAAEAGAHTHSIAAPTYGYLTTKSIPNAFSSVTIPQTFTSTNVYTISGTGTALTTLTSTTKSVLSSLNTITKGTFVTSVGKSTSNFVSSITVSNKLDRATVYSAGATVSVLNGASVDADGVLSFSSGSAVGSRTATTVAVGTVSTSGTGATVATGYTTAAAVTNVTSETGNAATNVTFNTATVLETVTGSGEAFAKRSGTSTSVLTGVSTNTTAYVGGSATTTILAGLTTTATGTLKVVTGLTTATGASGTHTHSVSLS